jgi:hypothetical protein
MRADYCMNYYIRGLRGHHRDESRTAENRDALQLEPNSAREGEMEFSRMVGGRGHYLNSHGELGRGVLELLKVHRDRLGEVGAVSTS